MVYTPAHFTLSKNPELHLDTGRLDALSPNTLRRTNSLDNILNDDDYDDDDDDDGGSLGGGGSVGSGGGDNCSVGSGGTNGSGRSTKKDLLLQQPQLLNSKQQEERIRIRRGGTPITTNLYNYNTTINLTCISIEEMI